MTANTTKNFTLVEYSREILPKIRTLLEKQAALKEWKAEDEEVQEHLVAIKDMQDGLKSIIEEREADLIGEIKDLQNDIKLACKGAAKGTAYKPAELAAFFSARAKDKVEDVVEKGSLFKDLTVELA